MAIGITAGSITNEIGTPSFVHAFFSTISAHCEPEGWGSKFPCLMLQLYQGKLPHEKAPEALRELSAAKAVLAHLSPGAVVWDIDDKKAQPPWGSRIAPRITSLGNYFVSSTGRDVFTLIEEVLNASVDDKSDVIVR